MDTTAGVCDDFCMDGDMGNQETQATLLGFPNLTMVLQPGRYIHQTGAPT
jgi:hypothetical protein